MFMNQFLDTLNFIYRYYTILYVILIAKLCQHFGTIIAFAPVGIY